MQSTSWGEWGIKKGYHSAEVKLHLSCCAVGPALRPLYLYSGRDSLGRNLALPAESAPVCSVDSAMNARSPPSSESGAR